MGGHVTLTLFTQFKSLNER